MTFRDALQRADGDPNHVEYNDVLGTFEVRIPNYSASRAKRRRVAHQARRKHHAHKGARS